MSVSKDGKKLLTGGFGGHLQMWEIETGAELLQIEMPINRYSPNERESIRSVVFLPDGQSAITGNCNSVHSWNLQTGSEIREFHSEDHDWPDICRDIVKFSGWRHQAASSTLSPSSNLHFMLMTSAKS